MDLHLESNESEKDSVDLNASSDQERVPDSASASAHEVKGNTASLFVLYYFDIFR